MLLDQNAKLHNEFKFEKINNDTGEVTQTAKAYNIVLNSIYTRLCAGASYFTNIHFGTGTGVPSPDRTTLFSYLGTRVPEDVELVKDYPISIWKRKITLLPSEYNGQSISEVGIAYGTGANNLVTHALLKDSEGNPIVMNKTDRDTIIIYATFYIDLTSNYDNFKLVGLPDNNSLLNYLVGGAIAPVGAFKTLRASNEKSTSGTGQDIGYLHQTSNVVWSSDIPARQRRTDIKRFDINDGNGDVQAIEFSDIFRITFPSVGIHEGSEYQNVPIGAGDGSLTEFKMPSNNIIEGTSIVKKDASIMPPSTYTINTDPYTPYLSILETDPTMRQSSMLSYFSEVDEKVITMHKDTNKIRLYSFNEDMELVPTVIYSDFILSEFYSYKWNMSLTHVMTAKNIGTSRYEIKLYELIGDTLVRDMGFMIPDTGSNGSLVNFDIDIEKGKMIVVTRPTIYEYDLIDGSWVRQITGSFTTSEHAAMFLNTAKDILIIGRNVSLGHYTIYKNIENVWTISDIPPLTVYNNYTSYISFSEDATLFAGVNNTSPYLWIKKLIAGEWTDVSNPFHSKYNTTSDTIFKMADDGKLFFVSSYNSPTTDVYKYIGGEFIQIQQFGTHASGGYRRSTGTTFVNRDGKFFGDAASVDPPYIRRFSNQYTTSNILKFNTPPAIGEVITADYKVKGVHKTENQVIDVSFAIQYGEGV